MKAIDRAKAHFDSLDIKKIKVPEWGDDEGNPLVIYSKPLTLQETSKLFRLSKEDDLTMMAYILIYKALDENGEKIFSLEDKNILLNKVSREVLVRVASEMMGNYDVDAIKKN